MKVFLSKKDNETKFELIQRQEDGKCEVRFLNGSKKGEITTYTSGTIKRWWKEVEVKQEKEISKETISKEKENLIQTLNRLKDAGFNVSIVKGLHKTISIKTVGQLALSKDKYRLKANHTYKFNMDVPYVLTKSYKKVICNTLDDVLQIIK